MEEKIINNKIVKLPFLRDFLLKKVRQNIEEWKKEKDTTTDEFLGNFSYLFWEYDEEADLADLKPIIDLMTSQDYRDITDINLAIANQNSNWREFPIGRFIVDYLSDFLNYLIPRIVNLENWEEGFYKYYNVFEKEYLSDEITVEFFGHLANFSYKYSDTGQLNDHTKIIVLRSFPRDVKHLLLCEKRADCFRVKGALKLCFPAINAEIINKNPYFLYYVRKIKKKYVGKMFNFYHLMKKFMLAVRILCYQKWSKPYFDFITHFYQGRLSSMLHHTSVSFPENEIGVSHNYAEMDYPASTWLRRLWEILENIDYLDRLIAFDHHLDDSLRRGVRSSKNPYSNELKLADELDRLSDYFSAFDSLYKNTKWGAGEIIANYTAKLVTYKRYPKDNRNPNNYNNVKDFMEAMYKIRNDYEHGRYKDALTKGGKKEQFEQRVFTVGRYLREVAILYIMNSDFELQLPKIKKDDFSGLKTIYY